MRLSPRRLQRNALRTPLWVFVLSRRAQNRFPLLRKTLLSAIGSCRNDHDRNSDSSQWPPLYYGGHMADRAFRGWHQVAPIAFGRPGRRVSDPRSRIVPRAGASSFCWCWDLAWLRWRRSAGYASRNAARVGCPVATSRRKVDNPMCTTGRGETNRPPEC